MMFSPSCIEDNQGTMHMEYLYINTYIMKAFCIYFLLIFFCKMNKNKNRICLDIRNHDLCMCIFFLRFVVQQNYLYFDFEILFKLTQFGTIQILNMSTVFLSEYFFSESGIRWCWSIGGIWYWLLEDYLNS